MRNQKLELQLRPWAAAENVAIRGKLHWHSRLKLLQPWGGCATKALPTAV
jgi:hypothetical protein